MTELKMAECVGVIYYKFIVVVVVYNASYS